MSNNAKQEKAAGLLLASLTGLLITIGLIATANPASAQYGGIIRERVAYSFTVSEFQPDTRKPEGQALHGGVVRTIAVHPTDISEFTIATATGGLFRSNNSGVSWRHLGSPGPWNYTTAVAYDPNNPNVMLATTQEDYSDPPTGGVWRSTDRGESWTQPESGRLQSAWSCDGRLDGYNIAFDPSMRNRVFVATNCGILTSVDAGLNWTRIVPGGGDTRFAAIIALGGNRIVAGGKRGVWYSADGGVRWTRETTGISEMTNTEMHGFAVSPYNSSHVFARTSGLRLYQSLNSGQTWALIGTPPADGGCGGTAFVKAIRTPTSDVPDDGSGRNRLTLYIGDKCTLFRKDVWSFPGSSLRFDFARSVWREDRPCHADTHDLVFDRSGRPILMATDGGVETHSGPRGACPSTRWALVGGVQNGLSALQVADVAGQQILSEAGEPYRDDLYIGTMHNDMWASTNNGRTWDVNDHWEGGLYQMHRRVPESSAKITYFTCAGCGNKEASAGLTSIGDWRNPNTTDPIGTAALIPLGRSDTNLGHYVQHGYTGARSDRGLYITPIAGRRWERLTSVTEDFSGYPHVFGAANPVIYQAIKIPATFRPAAPPQYRLLQVSEIYGDRLFLRTPTVVRPSMYFAERCTATTTSAQYVSLAWHTAAFFWWPIFDIDPSDPNHLIGIDVNSRKIVETRDGGECWQPLTQLTRLVTSEGKYRLFLPPPPGGTDDGIRDAFVSSISFNPGAPNQILIGTMQNGIFFTGDGGRTWMSIPDTARITHAGAFYWQSDDTVVVGSYGRGLWKLTWTMSTIREVVYDLCRLARCTVLDSSTLKPVPLTAAQFEEAMLVSNGRVIDVEHDEKMAVHTTPGSSHIFLTLDGKPGNLSRSSVRQDARSKEPLNETLRKIASNQVPIGIALDKGEMRYVVTSPQIARPEPPSVAPLVKIQGIKGDYLGQGPSISLFGGTMALGYPLLTREGDITLRGRGFQRGAPIRVQLDGREVSAQRQVDRNGAFQFKIKVEPELGKHAITVSQQINPNTVQSDSAFFIVIPDDMKKSEVGGSVWLRSARQHALAIALLLLVAILGTFFVLRVRKNEGGSIRPSR